MIKIDYILTGTGWSKCTISTDDISTTISASYLGDALGNLLSAILKLINGEKEATISFDEEPGEYRWRFKTTSDKIVHLTILEFDELWGNKPDSEGRKVFDTECQLRDLTAAVFNTAQKILLEYGEEGYIQKWIEHPFPIKQYETINKWLTSGVN